MRLRIDSPSAYQLTVTLVCVCGSSQVKDREVGNTGGLGGLYGIMYAIGKPLPFPEARPWKMSKRYRAFQALGNLMSRLQKK